MATRGQIAIITNRSVKTSCEFNGDMYPDGNGNEAVERLRNATNVATHAQEVYKFNDDFYNYNDVDLTYTMSLETLDFTKNYFDNWFSDYVYIKNVSKTTRTLKTRERDENGKDKKEPKEYQLRPNEIAVLCFGRLVAIYSR